MNIKKYLPESVAKRLDRGRKSIDDFVDDVAREVPEGVLLLDAGAGECWYKGKFSHTRYVSVDFALGKGDWDYGNLDVVADLLRLPFDSNTFDAVLCTQVLEHINRPRDFIKELQRVLRIGGVLYLSAPQGFKEHQAPHDYFRYTSFGLKYLFKEAGLDVAYTEPMGGFFFFLADRISPVHRYLFNNKRPLPWKLLFMPFEPLSKVLFSVLLPLLVGSLDGFDKKRKWTNGYVCKATKPGAVPERHRSGNG